LASDSSDERFFHRESFFDAPRINVLSRVMRIGP
jgi:hypothetical protein